MSIAECQSVAAIVGSNLHATNIRGTAKDVSLYNSCNDEKIPNNRKKRIVFIRHGKTYMNEYLEQIGWTLEAKTFSDNLDQGKYQDTRLSSKGEMQAKKLGEQLRQLMEGRRDAQHQLGLSDTDRNFMEELDLVVVSPLTRTLQTCELAVMPHIEPAASSSVVNLRTNKKVVPVLANPLAAERLYLISEIGRPRDEVAKEFPYVDMKSSFGEGISSLGRSVDQWWFTLKDDDVAKYVEWRPWGNGRDYMCPGEPQKDFDDRMNELYRWLQDRPESTICLVCHWGVINWFLDDEFENCELRVVPFEKIQPAALTIVENNEFANA